MQPRRSGRGCKSCSSLMPTCRCLLAQLPAKCVTGNNHHMSQSAVLEAKRASWYNMLVLLQPLADALFTQALQPILVAAGGVTMQPISSDGASAVLRWAAPQSGAQPAGSGPGEALLAVLRFIAGKSPFNLCHFVPHYYKRDICQNDNWEERVMLCDGSHHCFPEIEVMLAPWINVKRRVCGAAETGLAGNEEAIAKTGSLLWPRLAAAYIEARLAHVVPSGGSDNSKLDAYQRAGRAAQDFEAAAAALG